MVAQHQQFKNILNHMMATGVFQNEEQAVDILKASLQALRDRLPKVEAFHLGTRLEEPLREAFFDQWKNGARQAESLSKSDFLAEVENHLVDYEEHSLDELVPVALKAVLNAISLEKVNSIKQALPKSLHEIFNDSLSM